MSAGARILEPGQAETARERELVEMSDRMQAVLQGACAALMDLEGGAGPMALNALASALGNETARTVAILMAGTETDDDAARSIMETTLEGMRRSFELNLATHRESYAAYVAEEAAEVTRQ